MKIEEATESKFDQPYISLKFGGIKSIDFKDNEEAKKVYEQGYETKEQEIAIIKAYKGNFWLWWEDRWVTKKTAIDYLLNYKHS